ncbi:MAG TPA: hypothetical protein QGF58_08035 [Myxococcota bacterium]|nr:hypothetical protein [Myxococcota bacterium]
MALEAWIRALVSPSEETVAEACAEGVRVYRYRVFEDRGELAETFTGRSELLAWPGRSPPKVAWTIETDDGATARYKLSIEDFENGGLWHYTLDEEGKVLELHHHADAISQDPPDV